MYKKNLTTHSTLSVEKNKHHTHTHTPFSIIIIASNAAAIGCGCGGGGDGPHHYRKLIKKKPCLMCGGQMNKENYEMILRRDRNPCTHTHTQKNKSNHIPL